MTTTTLASWSTWPRRGHVEFVDVPELSFLAVDGEGEPGGPEFTGAVSALFSVAYPIRFALRKQGIEEKVAPLEALWWQGTRPSDPWRWRVMIRLPAAADEVLVAGQMNEAKERHPELTADIDRLQHLTLTEGPAAQVLHVGPYDAEAETLDALRTAIAAAGYRCRGAHHEIYLSDPRRCAPEHLRTVLRQPIE